MTEKTAKDLTERQAFERKCYELYQLEWMMAHGYSLKDYLNVMVQNAKEMFDPMDFRDADGSLSYEHEFDESDFDRAAQQAEDVFLTQSGFGHGELFASESEFLVSEYTDLSYMKWLFETQVDTEADKLKALYRKFTGNDVSTMCNLKVHTSAGTLRAYKTDDPGQPGICVMLEPAGFDDEIDMAFVSVYEDPGYATEGERAVDVAIMCYADPSSEDYTSKSIVKREDVCKALEETVEYRLTDTGKKNADQYIAELAAKRKEILDAGLDTADSTYIPVLEDIEDDVNSLGVDDKGEYYNGWAVTDNHDADYPLLLKLGRDLEKV